jgi:DNA processing protein
MDHAEEKDVGPEAHQALHSGRAERRTDAVLRSIRALGIRVIRDSDPAYPAAILNAAASGVLANLREAPVMLFARGDLSLLDRRWLAVVGTRRMTEYGETVARRFAGFLARSGEVVASGLARGIDAAAHEAALAAGGTTTAVTGCGLDVVYPPEHARLQDRIAERGLLLSGLPPGEPPVKHHFLHRNAILAALSRGVLVVEAPAGSGALSTASCVTRLGGDVLAVPGPIGRPTSEGSNALFRDNGVIVLDESDLIIGFHLSPETAPAPALAAPEPTGVDGVLWNALSDDSRHIDELSSAAGLDTGQTLARLLALELSGSVRQLPGLRFTRVQGV